MLLLLQVYHNIWRLNPCNWYLIKFGFDKKNIAYTREEKQSCTLFKVY